MGFGQGVSGLNASAASLDVIGNNIANSGTWGFKSGSASFADVYAGSRIGSGTKMNGVALNFKGGDLRQGTGGLDMAVSGGDGFFRVVSSDGNIAYTRNGQFSDDKDGFIVNASGQKLTGFPVGPNGQISGGAPVPFQLSKLPMAPKETTAMSLKFNFDSGAKQPAVNPFDPDNAESYNFQNSSDVYDTLGNKHNITTFVVKNPAGDWSMYATADGWPLDANGAKVAEDPANPGKPDMTLAAPVGANITFDNRGTMLTPANGKFAFAGLDFGNGAAQMKFVLDATGTTQRASDFNTTPTIQNGYAVGVMNEYTMDKDGTIIGVYSNGERQPLGQVVLSSFANPNGLRPNGDNCYSETTESGQPVTGAASSGGRGDILAGYLEASNVEMTGELVNMIVAQRTYQANAQTVKTQDQVMQTLVSMR
ncbi:flagellar hook protein FlgE [Glaciimonas soli]|uniref:Flagellar hook protein FlgE n=1 Tax=Glaciimonas soli TaxID=2590999 RepID=A0A843YPJ0_9BURK|nr:flagellar hook protein FlgE [Glaciimonas soli]MQQ99462.1 flagellar hook-basal body complex protein [Glaciimonas soli]